MPDPSPFLSTIAATSAAMVAIVGGLLVARFVTIASEQEGAQRLLEDAQDRLSAARRREQEAREQLHNWYIDDFFEAKVIQAIGDGEHDIHALRKRGSYSPLTDDELAVTIKEITDEFAVARSTLRELLAGSGDLGDQPEWGDFKHLHPSLPDASWDEVWEAAYEGIVRPPQPRAASHGLFGGLDYPGLSIAVPTPPEYVALDIQRRDALRNELARATQRVEDLDGERDRHQRSRDAIVRPKGLGWGLIVLAFFTFVGVIIPIWLMSRAPKRLTAHFGEVVFWLFFAGLLALLIYMGALALRLSGWRRTTSPKSSGQHATDASHS